MATADPAALALAQAVREACLSAALEAYDEAGVLGMCHEGRWERATDALRALDLAPVVAALPPPVADLPLRFAFDGWATERVAAHLAALPAVPEPARKWLAHIVGAQSIWHARIAGEPAPLPSPWPDWALAATMAEAAANRGRYDQVLARLAGGELRLDMVIEYKTLAGQPFATPLGDILTHLLLHGQYHRGQIASAVRQAGHAPVATDFVVYSRDRAAGR